MTTNVMKIWLNGHFDDTTARFRAMHVGAGTAKHIRVSTSPVMEEECDALESSIVTSSHVNMPKPTTTSSSYLVCHVPTIQPANAKLGWPTRPKEFDEETHELMRKALAKIRRQIAGAAFEIDEEEEGDLWPMDNPRDPHRGFETITITKQGLIDHSDSLGAAARFGEGDTQWLTAGKGIVHCEMFPMVEKDPKKGNPTDFFQIWLNLPKSDKMVDPHFTMLWADATPTYTVPSSTNSSATATVRTIAGSLSVPGSTTPFVAPPLPPPSSYASKPWSNMAIWTVDMQAGSEVTIPAVAEVVPSPQGKKVVTRSLYFFDGASISVSDADDSSTELPVSRHAWLALDVNKATTVRNSGSTVARLLMLQASPLGEPVAQHGPFVMNTRQEIFEAFMDYRETQFGGWKWPSDEPTHGGAEVGRFARHPNGKLEKKFEGKVKGPWGAGLTMSNRVSQLASHLVVPNETAAGSKLVAKDPFSRSDPYITALVSHNDSALKTFIERNGTTPITVSFDSAVPHVAVIKFNNPSQFNSLSVAMGQAFGRIIDFLMDSCRDIRAVVLTGEGKAFCAGADLRRSGTRQKGADSEKVYEGSEFYNLYLGPIRRCKVPIIAAVNGHAIGAGFSVALACDMRTAYKDARVGVNFVRLGLHPGMAATQTLPLLLGTQHANRLLLTGELQPASHPLMSPIFLSLHDSASATLDAALDVARKCASASPLAVQATTRTLRMRWESGLEQVLEREGWGQMMGRIVEGGAQVTEGTRATAEKRDPVFRPAQD
ncbi:hypothetical protein HDU93_005568 [Gonapodya sp. JEL0774]|nr:hypothetical protein HDU93_005568 [Gonapodya sp. JEL0774]